MMKTEGVRAALADNLRISIVRNNGDVVLGKRHYAKDEESRYLQMCAALEGPHSVPETNDAGKFMLKPQLAAYDYWNRRRDMECDLWADMVRQLYPEVRSYNDFVETRLTYEVLDDVCRIFRIAFVKGEIVSLHQPSNRILYGNWLDDPDPDRIERINNARSYNGERDLPGAFKSDQGKRERPFPGSASDEFPWDDDSTSDLWGCGPETTTVNGKVVRMATRRTYPPRRPARVTARYIVRDVDGKEIARFELKEKAEAMEFLARMKKNGITSWLAIDKVDVENLLASSNIEFFVPTFYKEASEWWRSVRLEHTTWWRVFDHKLNPIKGLAGSGSRWNKGFPSLSWSFETNTWSNKQLRDEFIADCKKKADEGNVIIRSADRTPWGTESVSVLIPISDEIKEKDDAFISKQEFKPAYFEVDVLGPPVLVRALRDQMRARFRLANVEDQKVFQSRTRRTKKAEERSRLAKLYTTAKRRHDKAAKNDLGKAREMADIMCTTLKKLNKGAKHIVPGPIPEKPIGDAYFSPTSVSHCHKCGRQINRKRLNLARLLTFEWVILNWGPNDIPKDKVRPVIEERVPYDMANYAKSKARRLTRNASISAKRQEQNERREMMKHYREVGVPYEHMPNTSVPYNVYEAVCREIADNPSKITWNNPEAYLIHRCTRVIKGRPAKCIRRGRTYTYVPAIPSKVVFCDGTDVVAHVVAKE